MKKDDLFYRAIIYGLGFGLLAAVLWFAVVILTDWYFGIVAIGIGYLVGFGVSKGAGKSSLKLQFLSACLTTLSILLSEYFITNHMVYEYFKENLIETYYLLSPVIVVEGLYYAVIDSPMMLLFWAIAIYFGFRVAGRFNYEEKVEAKEK